MASNSYTKVLVYLRKTSQAGYQLAKFNECVLDHLGQPGEALVHCHLENNQLLLESPDQDQENSANLPRTAEMPPLYKIMHPPFCPVQHLDEEGCAALPPEIITRGIAVGVAILLESSDKHLLLTRRAAHMRTFAHVWVPPGGHVENKESLEDAALRELEEETGLVVTAAERQSTNTLGLWESVFPPLLQMGQPKRHHIVVYLHVILHRSSEQLKSQFKLCPEEVDAAVWLSVDLIKFAVWKTDEFSEQEQENTSSDEKIHVTLVNQEGEHVAGSMKASFLKQADQVTELTLGRVSTGSRFALSLWLEQHLQKSDFPGSSQRALYGRYMSQSDAENHCYSASPKIKPKI
ncbi:nucleoside diphosphate-linked moiety X motif 17-like [Homarus americanus]|uniref:Nucleoside diphosphate-linked moiety X motif 17-like 1 n=1 Tax=Homarus americanus TaxID=6706 RepID=A0A8J5JIP1_HOMAM|nr:nucleoside diphosphate-linked moiety X motif 17-like [Homarus americanus]KAG7158310.1 Nucleoside diphosphate-linked moiety X motif 17-like 1 [Homarus americanus]